MRKIVWMMLFLLFCIIVAACSNSEVTNTSDKTDSASNKEQQENVEQNNQDDGNQENEDSDITETNKTGEEKVKKVKPKYEVSDIWSIVPLDEQTNKKVALITIDDAPDQYALKMAQTLKSLDVNAIFFINGHLIEAPEKKKILKQIYDMGFVIGNHTYSHDYLPDLSKEEQKEEIIRVNDRIEEIIGERPKFFRAPNGANTDFTKQIAKKEGMTLMNWSYGYDWHKEYMTKEAITDIMLNTDLLRSGANLLMHDREWTAGALGDIVNGLRDKGYELVDPKLIKTTG